MDRLPDELVLHIIAFLPTVDIVSLQLVSRRFFTISRDNRLWRILCFENPSHSEKPALIPRIRALERATTSLVYRDALNGSNNGSHESVQSQPDAANERARILANWDLSYPGERVNWYQEYIHRHASISLSWLKQPQDAGHPNLLEVRGMGLFRHGSNTIDNANFVVVAPMDDDSVCLWNLSGQRALADRRKSGKVLARSRAGLLLADRSAKQISSKARCKTINSGIVECVSVDSVRKRAYFAVQNGLSEVDLETLKVVSYERFPFPISALSEVAYPVPLTVGTSLSLHLHDPRVYNGSRAGDFSATETCDRVSTGSPLSGNCSWKSILSPSPVTTTGPLSILHLPSSCNAWDGNGDIYVAGRFPSILNYDRRTFPKLRGTIYSGARLCSLATLPHPFMPLELDLMRRGELSLKAVHDMKSTPGKTLIACGEYRSKGSLEFYGLSQQPHLPNVMSSSSAGRLQNSSYKNRQTCSSSKLLSVATHGTRLVFSDGCGMIKWVERNGFSEVRRWNMNGEETDAEMGRGIFASATGLVSSSGDIARKILPTGIGDIGNSLDPHDLVIWTGDRIGLLTFSPNPMFETEDNHEITWSVEELKRQHEEREYVDIMRKALEGHADEARFVRGLGFGPRAR